MVYSGRHLHGQQQFTVDVDPSLCRSLRSTAVRIRSSALSTWGIRNMLLPALRRYIPLGAGPPPAVGMSPKSAAATATIERCGSEFVDHSKSQSRHTKLLAEFTKKIEGRG
nr:unnamed protein product [Digitaria exilis]